jgi:glycosyltransferase involved in cell wall biosynthesis
VAHDLVESLVELGHQVTVFAPRGSTTSAVLVETCDEPLEGSEGDRRLAEELHVARAMEAARSEVFDLVHSHLHVHALVFSRLIGCPLVTTLHGAGWNPAHHPTLTAYAEQPFISISRAERRFLPQLNYVATVYNGIRIEDFEFRPEKDDYLLFAGRMAPEKAPDLAIAAARQSGSRLVLVGSLEPKHAVFFETSVRPGLGAGVEYLGGVSRPELVQLMAGARGLIMPLRWDEPFGLVVVEAMATGTPVVAWNRGAMPELIVDGKHGFLVEAVEKAVAAIGRLDQLDPHQLRHRVEERFTREAMASSYLDAFENLLGRGG